MENTFEVGQVVIAKTPVGIFVGEVESINPTQSRQGRPYETGGIPAVGLAVEDMDDTLWVPNAMILGTA